MPGFTGAVQVTDEANKALRELVLPEVTRLLPLESWFLSTWTPKKSDYPAGGDITKRFQDSTNMSAAGVSRSGDLPYKGSGTHDRFTITPKKYAAQFAISGSLLKSGTASRNAAEDYYAFMIRDCKNSMLRLMDRMAWSTGTGRLGEVASHAGGSTDVVFDGQYDKVRHFHKGQKVYLKFAANAGVNSTVYTVSSVNQSTGTVTFTGAVHNDCADGDIAYMGLQGATVSKDYDLIGFLGHIDDGKILSTYQGKTRASTPFANGTVVWNSGTLATLDLNTARRNTRIFQNKCDLPLTEPMMVLADQGILDEYERAHLAAIQYTPEQMLGTGKQKLQIAGYPLEAIRSAVPYHRIFYIIPSVFEFMEVTPLDFVQEDGHIMVRDSGDQNRHEYFVTMVGEGAFWNGCPPASVVYQDISETTYDFLAY